MSDPVVQLIVSPNEPWVSTDILLAEGDRIRITAVADGKYADKGLACDANGPLGKKGRLFDRWFRNPGPLSPIRWTPGFGAIRHLRVLQDRDGRRASFLTLIAAIGRDDAESNVRVVGSGADLIAHRAGPLFLFANDWPGGVGEKDDARFFDADGHLSKTYSNNEGSLSVTIERLA
ncbi:MAG: hypothetical protein JNK37_09590 [Verrucomicrobiales bacterium]|nr:hypothetical protein [Verrucomicrobiales bacterium]